jgi:hypothetical protein
MKIILLIVLITLCFARRRFQSNSRATINKNKELDHASENVLGFTSIIDGFIDYEFCHKTGEVLIKISKICYNFRWEGALRQ